MKVKLDMFWASLFCSIIGLILIYLAALNLEAQKVEIKEIDFDMIGRFVETEGKIIYKKSHPSGHLFLTIENKGSKIQVPLFANVMNDLKEIGFDEDDFAKGKIIRVKGIVNEYREQLQVIPRSGEDVEIVSG